MSEPSETFQRGSGRSFATVDVKKFIFWAAYWVPDLFNCKRKPFISTVLVNANRLLAHAGHGHGRLEQVRGIKVFEFTEINMAHIIISLKGPGTKCAALTTKCFASANAQDHELSV